MIKKIRNKFIRIAMLTIAVCTTILVLAINVVNFVQVDREVNILLEGIGNNGGQFPNALLRDKEKGPLFRNPGGPFPLEAQFENRFFTVIYRSDGNVMTDLGHIASVDEETALQIAQEAREGSRDLDYLDTYKFYRVERDNGDMVVVVLDVESRLASMTSLAKTSLFMELICIIFMFLIIALSSGVAIRPFVESQKKQKQFITDASHELKTPLTVIATNMDILSMDLGENEWVDGTRKQVSSLRRLVNHMVSLSKMEEDDHRLVMACFDFSLAVEEAAEPFAGMAEFEGIAFEEAIERDVWLKGDENAIRQLVGILCDNAIKYVDKDGSVSLRVKKKGRRTILEIANSCSEGMDPEVLNRLFDRFYRGDSSRTRGNGRSSFGIGLSIARAIVEKQGGRIAATQEKDNRIIFRCTF